MFVWVMIRSNHNGPERTKPQALDAASLDAIAKKIKTGEIQLPDVDLETNQEYDSVWALVDSGAGANVARRDNFPNFRPR